MLWSPSITIQSVVISSNVLPAISFSSLPAEIQIPPSR
jgi:hypothetical protein